jgi:hypothetical protein
LAGCAQLATDPESGVYAERMQAAAEGYHACMNREAAKDMKNPTSAEDIATAAHGRCWGDWDKYREATNASFSHNARTREEMQFAHDKAEAHLRQFEREARRSIVDSAVARSLKSATTP